MIKEEKVFVYSTDSEEHKMNFGEKEELNTLGLIQNKDGSWEIDESLMWNGEFDKDERN